MSTEKLCIADFCKTGSGGTPSRKNDSFFRGDIPWVKSGELKEEIIFNSEEKITSEAVKKSSAKIVPKNSILVAMYGATVGRVAMLGIDATTNQAICHVIPDTKRADAKYLFYSLQNLVPELLSRRVGGAQPNISQAIIKSTKISLPSIEEQKRIATILDKANAIRRKREKAIEFAEDFLKSVFLDMFGDPLTNSKEWVIERIHSLIDSIETGLNINGENRLREKNEFGVLKISAVTTGTFIPNEHKVVLAENVRRKVSPRKGDLLFSRANTRELVAATCIVEKDEPNLFLPDKLWRINTKKNKLKKEYLKYLFTNKQFRMELTKQATGTSGSMLNISQKKLLNLNIPLPPIELQKKFAAIFWRYSETIKKFNELKKDSGHLFLSLSQRAFRGDL